jgi:hypothetical protein
MIEKLIPEKTYYINMFDKINEIIDFINKKEEITVTIPKGEYNIWGNKPEMWSYTNITPEKAVEEFKGKLLKEIEKYAIYNNKHLKDLINNTK